MLTGWNRLDDRNGDCPALRGFPVAIRNNIRTIYKDKRMNEYRTHQITGRGDLYSLEMIAALSFRVRTMESEAFREWLLYRPQHKMVVMQIESDELCPVS